MEQVKKLEQVLRYLDPEALSQLKKDYDGFTEGVNTVPYQIALEKEHHKASKNRKSYLRDWIGEVLRNDDDIKKDKKTIRDWLLKYKAMGLSSLPSIYLKDFTEFLAHNYPEQEPDIVSEKLAVEIEKQEKYLQSINNGEPFEYLIGHLPDTIKIGSREYLDELNRVAALVEKRQLFDTKLEQLKRLKAWEKNILRANWGNLEVKNQLNGWLHEFKAYYITEVAPEHYETLEYLFTNHYPQFNPSLRQKDVTDPEPHRKPIMKQYDYLRKWVANVVVSTPRKSEEDKTIKEQFRTYIGHRTLSGMSDVELDALEVQLRDFYPEHDPAFEMRSIPDIHKQEQRFPLTDQEKAEIEYNFQAERLRLHLHNAIDLQISNYLNLLSNLKKA